MRLRAILVASAAAAVAVAAAVAAVVLLTADDEQAAGVLAPAPDIDGPQLQLGDLVYAVTDVRLLDVGRTEDEPYLVNLQAASEGVAYLGVFVRIVNRNLDDDLPSAPGFLLEPRRDPGKAALNQSSESAHALDQGGIVPAGGEARGSLLLYKINGAMTAAQPFDLVVHTGTETGRIELPHVPEIADAEH